MANKKPKTEEITIKEYMRMRKIADYYFDIFCNYLKRTGKCEFPKDLKYSVKKWNNLYKKILSEQA